MSDIDDNNKNNSKKHKTLIIILASFMTFFFVLFVIFFTLFLIEFLNLGGIEDAFIYAVNNKVACSTDPTKCNIIQGNAFPAPTSIDTTIFQKNVAQFCLAQVSAIGNPDNTTYSPELKLISTLYTNENEADGIGYILLDTINSIVYVVYRGTQTTTEINEDLNWSQEKQNILQTTKTINKNNKKQSNFIEKLTSESSKKLTKIKQLGKNNNNTDLFKSNPSCSNNILIHDGFVTVFNQISDQLIYGLKSCVNQWNTLVFSGHSLGGAIASLSAFYVNYIILTPLQPSYNMVVYTFGKPRVGNIDFSICVDSLGYNVFRLQNEDDAVPQLPLSVTPNLTVYNEPWFYEHEGSPLNYQLNWLGLDLNHSLPNYLNFINSM